MTPIRVMVVDDHPLVRSAVARAITADDMVVVAEAATAEEALAVAPRVAPDILLLDISMPGMSGLELVRELAPRLRTTKILMLTVSSADRDVAEAMRSGASGYLTKDLSPEALVRALRATQSGELVIPRKLAARLLLKSLRRPDPVSPAEASPLDRLHHAGAGRPAPPRRRLQRPRHRHGADNLHPHCGIAVSSILRKLEVRNRTDAARHYREQS